MSYTDLIAAVDFTDALLAVGGVAAAIAIFKVGAKGARMVLGFIR